MCRWYTNFFFLHKANTLSSVHILAGGPPLELRELNMAQVCEANMMDHPAVKLPLCRALRRQLGDKASPI